MTRGQKVAITLAATILVLPAMFLTFAFTAWSLLQPGPESIDASDLPNGFPVLTFWRDEAGAYHCAPRLYRDVKQDLGAGSGLSFTVPQSQEGVCRDAFTKWGSAASFEVLRVDGQRHEVNVRFRQDSDAPNDSWYTTYEGTTTIEKPRYWNYFGPGLGMAALILAVPPTIVTYVVLAIGAAIWSRRVKHRRAA